MDEMKVAVIGAGLVGSLMACYLGKKGYHVDLYERREDIRQMDVVHGRSINLALSCRGRAALAGVGLEDKVVRTGTPMYSRMIHDLDGSQRVIPYGIHNEAIISIDRRMLNEVLLTATEEYPNVRRFFQHKLVNCDFDTGVAQFEVADQTELVRGQYDLVIGCDGAYSQLRQQVMRTTRLYYEQAYIPHGYIELAMPPIDGEWPMAVNHLHIWARETYMMIALPNNKDKSFVVTLFMPITMYETLKTRDDVMRFFKATFADSIPLIGEEKLIDTVLSSTPGSLISVKCSPYHVGNNIVFMGDAAHAMVPFYGQGMNCGLEDVLVFNQILNENNGDIGSTLPAFSEFRAPDAQAINELSMDNYVVMRASVNSRLWLLRKVVDNLLHRLLPNTWIPLYTTVSFSRQRYSLCITNHQWQNTVLLRVSQVAGVVLACGAMYMAYMFRERSYVSTFTNIMSQASSGRVCT